MFRTNFKHQGPSATVQRRLRKGVRDLAEQAAMSRVRTRDKHCRFPLCGCRRLRLGTEVSHNQHRGMGGNPAGDRTDPALMMLLCFERHQRSAFSIHQGTVAWRPRTAAGADGPVRWFVDVGLLRYRLGLARRPRRTVLVEVAREEWRGEAEVDEKFLDLVTLLGRMDL